MSITTKRKYVTQEVLEEYVLPEGDRKVVKVLGGRGNNLHEVQTPEGEVFLASMPTRFRKNVWIKRGDYVLVIPIAEGDKVKAEIFHILYKDQIKYIQEHGLWPKEFDDVCKKADEAMIPDDMLPPTEDSEDDEEHSASDDENSPDEDVPVYNPNRPSVKFQDEEADCNLITSNEDEDEEQGNPSDASSMQTTAKFQEEEDSCTSKSGRENLKGCCNATNQT